MQSKWAAAALLIAVLGGCGGDDEADVPATGGEGGTTVTMQNNEFVPDDLAVNVGDTVTWTNQDEVPHTATGEDRDVLQSGTIAPGASFSQVFPEAGEFGYFCEFHPNMTGTIVVQ